MKCNSVKGEKASPHHGSIKEQAFIYPKGLNPLMKMEKRNNNKTHPLILLQKLEHALMQSSSNIQFWLQHNKIYRKNTYSIYE